MSSDHSLNDLSKDGSSTENIVYFEKTYNMGWLLPLLLIVLAAGLVLYFMKGVNDTSVPGIAYVEDTAAEAIVPDSSHITLRKSLSIRLSDSTEITAYKNGIENKLILYIMSKNPVDSISKNRWFDFDDLNFKTGSAELTDSSMHQVHNIAVILKVYPKVKIKIGGYTDKTGDEKLNMQLSQARADAVVNALKKAGANPAQLVGAEGYGSQFAKAAANAPDEEKQKDRRISVNVRAK
ncbi:OmpA family protein [Panacibacter ginsenosidivorans]|uniref:OmpA family protein n=1 Tax=Panacibacter ginsenosidivorans TaxID=1813871 RepID=A0A5B8V823_9BACT|nr:OmpA family protein [Panacibacter ginsenosidivorans]QEC67637.1 OmpA family protein [Panacibacter ginsenosidivorans]